MTGVHMPVGKRTVWGASLDAVFSTFTIKIVLKKGIFMMRQKVFLRLLGNCTLALALLIGFSVNHGFAASSSSEKKAILVVSYGSGQPEALKLSIESIEKSIQEAFPDYYVCRAFTSQDAINELMNCDGIKVGNAKEALERLKEDGYTEVVVQPLNITADEDYARMKEAVQCYQNSKVFDKIAIGRPLLYYMGQEGQPDDYLASVFAIEGEFPMLQCCNGLVLIGHDGVHHDNDAYATLQGKIDKAGFGNIYICALEGYPSLEDVLAKLHSKRLKKITIAPFTLAIADKYSVYDVSSNDIEAVNGKLKASGLKVETYVYGLGENFNIQQLYIQHLKDAIGTLNLTSNKLGLASSVNSLLELQQISMQDAVLIWKKNVDIFIDVRTLEEFQQGHVPGAQLIPLSELESRLKEVPSDKKVLLICDTGKRSAVANILLQKHGFTNTCSAAGGMLAWTEEIEK